MYDYQEGHDRIPSLHEIYYTQICLFGRPNKLRYLTRKITECLFSLLLELARCTRKRRLWHRRRIESQPKRYHWGEMAEICTGKQYTVIEEHDSSQGRHCSSNNAAFVNWWLYSYSSLQQYAKFRGTRLNMDLSIRHSFLWYLPCRFEDSPLQHQASTDTHHQLSSERTK